MFLFGGNKLGSLNQQRSDLKKKPSKEIQSSHHITGLSLIKKTHTQTNSCAVTDEAQTRSIIRIHCESRVICRPAHSSALGFRRKISEAFLRHVGLCSHLFALSVIGSWCIWGIWYFSPLFLLEGAAAYRGQTIPAVTLAHKSKQAALCLFTVHTH